MPSISDRGKAQLLKVARASIEHGFTHRQALATQPAEYAADLQAHLASFVTLQRGGQLRGCIGHLEAVQPLVADVAENAFAAAFRDPRFQPLQRDEFSELAIHVSVLSAPTPIAFHNEDELLRQLRPGIDGLILEDGHNRGTFLPSVWESLPNPGEFLTQLKLKAGLAPNHWSNDLRVARYVTESFGAES